MTLFAETDGGLCNCLIELNNLISFKRKFPKIRIVLIWWRRESCGCYYEDLFKKLDGIKVINFSTEIYGPRYFIYKKQFLDAIKEVCNRYWYPTYLKLTAGNRIESEGGIRFFSEEDFIKAIEKNSSNRCFARLKTGYRSEYRFDRGKDVLGSGIFNDIIMKRVSEIQETVPGKYIGVHVRMTDFKEILSCSPIEDFIQLIERESKIDVTRRFFIATDDREVTSMLSNRFQERVFYNEDKEYSRIGKKAMQDAAVDLLLLAHSEKIYGTTRSTFSFMASEMGNVVLETVGTLA